MAKMMGSSGYSPMNFQRTSNNQSNVSNQNDSYSGGRRARSNNFTMKETFDLLKVWASPDMQWQMKHNFRNFRVWEAIAYAMREAGHDRTAIQCKNRIQNLTSIYYRIKKSKQDYRSFNFPYYKIIGDVLEGKKNGANTSMGNGLSPGALALAAQNNFGNSTNGLMISPNQNSNSGMAAHMALVEEYQHLINGNPDACGSSNASQTQSHSGNGGMSVLSPEVSMSEGNSPIRMESQGSAANASLTTSQDPPISPTASSMSFNNRSGQISKIDIDDGDEQNLGSEYDQDNSDYEEHYLNTGPPTPSEMNGNMAPSMKQKRSMSASFSNYGGMHPAKRPRVSSTATNVSSGMADDPIAKHLAEMVDIEKQWLDLERERAENERTMMMYMMQILQALVGQGQSQEEENEEGNEGGEGDNEDAEDSSTKNDAQNDCEETSIQQMIEREENHSYGEDGEAENSE